MNGDVIIRKQKISVKTSDEQVALDCRQYLNGIVTNELPKLYERVFYQNIPSDSYINIQSLYIDLGVITKSELKQQFIQNVEQKIVNELRKQFEENPRAADSDFYPDKEPSIQYTAEKQKNTEALLYFLEHGNYPWWYKKEKRKTPGHLLNDLNISEQSGFLLKIVTKSKSLGPSNMALLVKRFVNYLNEAACENYIKQIAELYSDNSIKANIAVLLKQKILFATLFNISLKAFYEEALCSIIMHASESDFLKFFVSRLHRIFSVSDDELLKNISKIDDKIPPNLFSAITNNNLNLHHIKKPEKLESSQQEEQEFYIDNTGLILLHPFLPAYFNGLKLTDEHDRFKSFEAQTKAAVLLYYLQCSNVEYKEWEMPLNKILCGLAPNDVILSGIELSEDEIEESLLLLTTVVGYWSALKGSSIESVQNTFFLREGKLARKQDSWLLQVERTAVDVLLDRLPWGISTIKLPWLKELIHTEW